MKMWIFVENFISRTRWKIEKSEKNIIKKVDVMTKILIGWQMFEVKKRVEKCKIKIKVDKVTRNLLD